MKKFIVLLGVVGLVSLGLAGVVLAKEKPIRDRAHGPKKELKAEARQGVDVVCMVRAIDARDTAVMAAVDAHHVALKAALTVRKNAFKAAWALTDKDDRHDALKDAVADFRDAQKSAKSSFQTAKKAAWNQFAANRKACGAGANSSESPKIDSGL